MSVSLCKIKPKI